MGKPSARYLLKSAVFILPVCEICHSHGSHDATSCVVLFDVGVSITEGTKIIAFRAVGSKIILTEWLYWYVLSRACFGMLLDVYGILKFGGMYGVCMGYL